MPSIQVPGAGLHYESFGSGPLLLLITGADGRGAVWHPVAQHLSAHYTTICYDRRGYSSSIITGTQDYSTRLTTDANDAALLIQHLSPSGQAIVVGNSSGAIVAQQLLLRHPECVQKLVSHEPPAFGALPAEFRQKGEGTINHIYDRYRSSGPIAAMEEFTSGLDTGSEAELMRSLMHPGHSDEIRANSLFWFEFELRQYPSSDVDVEGLLRLKEKVVPAAGVESGNGVGVGPISLIAGATGKEILRLPGGHIGFMTQPEAWAAALVEGLKKY
ncbi:alpha/beta-hydrolase [Aureobasidium subglaciale]|nr:alpha/beta-hydrolase [Aureobasidium subglaciale]